MSAEAEEAGATVLRGAVVGKLLAAHKNDVGNRGQALNIINDGRTAPESDDRRERRTDARDTPLALKRFHQSRLLADFVGAGASMPVAIEFLAGAEDVVAEEAFGVGVVDRLLHDGE